MSNYYQDVYLKRLNRYGLDYQSRLRGQLERDFSNYLLKTIYRVDFDYEQEYHPGSLERYKQDYTETTCYLLTKRDLVIPNGTILEIESQNGEKSFWMVWWLEKIESSGYNRYIVLKMTHQLNWKINEENFSVWGYFSGPGNSTINDTIESETGAPLYLENNNLHMFITTQNDNLLKNLYFEVKQGNITQGYVIREFDINSTPGVVYLSVDPVPLREEDKIELTDKDSNEDIFWLTGGKV